MFSWKEIFGNFRGICKKFNSCFDLFSVKQASDIDKNLKFYSAAAIKDGKNDITAKLRVRVNKLNA
jgi:hypothetical protein